MFNPNGGMPAYILALLFINAVTFAVYGLDKYFAKKRMCRVPESMLLLLAAIGGSVGALCGMYLFRHKTQHQKFTLGVPVILVAQIIAVFFVFH